MGCAIEMLDYHTYLNMQQTPNPEAQFPSTLPPWLLQSSVDRQTPLMELSELTVHSLLGNVTTEKSEKDSEKNKYFSYNFPKFYPRVYTVCEASDRQTYKPFIYNIFSPIDSVFSLLSASFQINSYWDSAFCFGITENVEVSSRVDNRDINHPPVQASLRNITYVVYTVYRRVYILLCCCWYYWKPLIKLKTSKCRHKFLPSATVDQTWSDTIRHDCPEIRVGNPSQKSGSEIRVEIRVGNPGRKSGSEIRVGNSGWKSESEIRVGNLGRKSESEIPVGNPGRKSRSEIWVGNLVRKIRVKNPGR
jgi:hypothetical protein